MKPAVENVYTFLRFQPILPLVSINTVLNIHINRKAYYGRGQGGGEGVWRWGRGRLYTYCYTVTTRMTCIKMGSDDSHFNVSLIVRDKVTRQCQQTTIFEEKGEPKRNRTEVPLLTSPTFYC